MFPAAGTNSRQNAQECPRKNMHFNFSPRRKLEDKRRMGIARVLNETEHPTTAATKRKKYNKVIEESNNKQN